MDLKLIIFIVNLLSAAAAIGAAFSWHRSTREPKPDKEQRARVLLTFPGFDVDMHASYLHQSKWNGRGARWAAGAALLQAAATVMGAIQPG